MADAEGAAGPPQTELRRSSRDSERLRQRLQAWLATKLPPDAAPVISELQATSVTGLSSETVLFEASWVENGRTRHERFVARLAPDPADVPVFPSYDMDAQFNVIRLVGELTDVPVPAVWWSERDPASVGTPFFVMEHVDGQVPPDVLPYNFGDNWVYEASAIQQRRLQDASVRILEALHAAPEPAGTFSFLEYDWPGDTHLRRHVAQRRAWYDFVGLRSELVDRAFRWLDEHWPSDEGETVLSWGDARIGNVLYRDFEPVAVLDWEMAGLGPRELDVGWMIYAHEVFEALAHKWGLEGMPGFMRGEDVAATYEALTGHHLRHLDFYATYAATQYAIVFLRTGQRSVRFGERELPEDPDELLHHRESFEAMLSRP